MWQAVVEDDGAVGRRVAMQQRVPEFIPWDRHRAIAQVQDEQHDADGQDRDGDQRDGWRFAAKGIIGVGCHYGVVLRCKDRV